MQPMQNIPHEAGSTTMNRRSSRLGDYAILRPGVQALPRGGAAIAHPDELTMMKASADRPDRDMHIPIFVFTGGDPLKRKDLFELIRYAASKDVHVAVTPSASRC